MGKLKAFFICAAALSCPILICTSSAAGEALRTAAYFSAGALPKSGAEPRSSAESACASYSDSSSASSYSESSGGAGALSEPPHNNSSGAESSGGTSSDIPEKKTAQVIEKNRSYDTDDTDLSQFNRQNTAIHRYAFNKSSAADYINLESGAQVRNLTDNPNSLVETTAKQLPDIGIGDPSEPVVLIYHTHTTESFLPGGDRCDKDYPNRSRDPDRNMTAVGSALCEALAENGVSSVHDCTVHDYPQYTNSYSRSEKTILQNLEEYPSLRIMIDIHRDGIADSDGSPVAPVVEINGKSAAQFMIISGCSCEDFTIPHYLENLKLACLIQNTSETLYPNLARSVLFDCREYNQSLRPGILLIEVGSHGNSLDEAVYTGELLGNIIAQSVKKLAESN